MCRSLEKGVQKVASLIASRPPLAVRGTKKIINYSRDHRVSDALDYVATWNAAMLPSSDIAEAMQAKMQSRAAKYQD